MYLICLPYCRLACQLFIFNQLHCYDTVKQAVKQSDRQIWVDIDMNLDGHSQPNCQLLKSSETIHSLTRSASQSYVRSAVAVIPTCKSKIRNWKKCKPHVGDDGVTSTSTSSSSTGRQLHRKTLMAKIQIGVNVISTKKKQMIIIKISGKRKNANYGLGDNINSPHRNQKKINRIGHVWRETRLMCLVSRW